jgi:RNA polymerase sigma-70 factor (ECF subfamily)
MMTQMMFCKIHLLKSSKFKKIQRRKQTVFLMYRIANEALNFLKKSKKEVSSETLQNKTIDNLKSDSYFDGNETK